MKKVSVAIPCRNEEKNIEECVLSILNSDYPNVDVTVVDGMSTDATRDILEALSRKYPNVKYVDNPKQLTPYAFNLGVKNSDGYYVQIVGSRNVLAPDYLSKLVEILEKDPQTACVGGDYQHSFENETAKFISFAMESKFGVGSDNYRTMKEDCYVDTVGVPMYRREIFDEIGYFDERLTRNQDDDFNFRVTSKGHKIFYRADAKVKYFVRGSLNKAFKQFSQYGYFKVFVNKKHKTVTTLRQLVPAAFVLFALLGGLLSLVSDDFLIAYLLVWLLYFSLGFAAGSAFSKKFPEILQIQLAILVLHLGYGYGYLKGVIDFLILGKEPSTGMQTQTT